MKAMVTIESSGTQQKAIVHDEKQWLNSGKQQYIVEAVSYTHLTLPTTILV